METKQVNKRARSSRPSTVERRTTIYDLPYALLCYIISFLPLRDAVRTGVLAHSWKTIWMSIPNWNLSFPSFPRMRNKKQRYEEFVDRVIYLHAGAGIQSMKICHTSYDAFSQRAQIWMQCLVHKHPLHELDINICYPVLPPSALFYCTTLVSLRLCLYDLSPNIPRTARLPNLSMAADSLKISPLLNLRSLNLRIWPNSGHTSAAAFLVRSFPALLHLHITLCENSSPGLYHNAERQRHPVPNDILAGETFNHSLKKVEIKKFRASGDEMKLLQYMLKTFLVLEELNVKFVTWINPPLISQAKKKARTLVRASPNVVVRIS